MRQIKCNLNTFFYLKSNVVRELVDEVDHLRGEEVGDVEQRLQFGNRLSHLVQSWKIETG